MKLPTGLSVIHFAASPHQLSPVRSCPLTGSVGQE